jgi:hypothetical protein
MTKKHYSNIIDYLQAEKKGIWTVMSSFHTKAKAQEYAKGVRENGFLARTVKVADGYVVKGCTRKRKGSKWN